MFPAWTRVRWALLGSHLPLPEAPRQFPPHPELGVPLQGSPADPAPGEGHGDSGLPEPGTRRGPRKHWLNSDELS